VLRNNFIAVIMVISTISFAVLSVISTPAFAQKNCSGQETTACAQSDLSLPVPSENDIAAPGLQQQPGDQSGDADEDSSGSEDESEDSDMSSDASTFLLPFP
jgi:hypothetical protein